MKHRQYKKQITQQQYPTFNQQCNLKGITVYYAQINRQQYYYTFQDIEIKKLQVRLDRYIIDNLTQQTVRQLTFMGFNIKIPANTIQQHNILQIQIDNNTIIALQKQEIKNFLRKKYITTKEILNKNNTTYNVTCNINIQTKIDKLKMALNTLKKL